MKFKKAILLSWVIIFFLWHPAKISATSDYVLPYPGLMPGNKIYQVKKIFDRLNRYWAFGNFSRHKYELKMADKKLVEAKTLFEYKQYLLAIKALEESNFHFKKASLYLIKAESEGKDVSQKHSVFKQASEKHQDILKELEQKLPKEFLWQPEKKAAIDLNLKSALEEAIKIREI